jgi:hypothetical protein
MHAICDDLTIVFFESSTENISSSIHEHIQPITTYSLDRLQQARHSDGKPMSMIYGPAVMKHRGGTIPLISKTKKGRLSVNAS